MNPDRVTHLVLEDPLGLADYRTGIPPQSEETLYEHELHWTDPATIRGYVAGYFVHPDPKVWEPLADVLVRVTLSPNYRLPACPEQEKGPWMTAAPPGIWRAGSSAGAATTGVTWSDSYPYGSR